MDNSWTKTAFYGTVGILLAVIMLAGWPRSVLAAEADPPLSLTETVTQTITSTITITVTSAITSTIQAGAFFTQTSGSAQFGYFVSDEGGIRFWSEYQRLGGVATLGYPASWRYVDNEGFIYQAFQGGILQWRPDLGKAVLLNIFEILHKAGYDEWLNQNKAIPTPIVDDGSQGNFQKAVEIRLSWLTNEPIRNYYFANPNPSDISNWTPANAVELYGLPMSKPERRGPFVIQRFQRVALQLWVDRVEGMPAPGKVVRVLGGDIMKELGLLPAPSVRPTTLDYPLLQVDAGLRAAVNLLSDDRIANGYAQLLLKRRIPVVFRPMREILAGLFNAGRPAIYINPKWAKSDVKALSAVILHELVHLNDFLEGRDLYSRQGCLASELRAFKVQSDYWERLTGPEGKTPPRDELETHLNSVLTGLNISPDQFANLLLQVYDEQCEPARR